MATGSIRSTIWLVLGVLFLVSLGGMVSTAYGAETMYPDDPQRQLKEAIEDAYGMYILVPSRRHPKERVEIADDEVLLWVYEDPRKPDYDHQKCEAFKNLLVGRFGDGGAKTFFDRFPKYRAVQLVEFRQLVSHSLNPDGKYIIDKTPAAYIKLRISRANAAKLDWKAVHELLDRANESKDSPKTPEPTNCIRTATKWIDNAFFSKEYFK